MIFKNVNDLSNKTEKRFFLELIEVFTRLIEVYCEKNDIKNYEDIILDCRTVEKKHRKYKYHIDANVLNDTNDDVAVKHDIKAEITRNNNSIYYTTYVDTEDGKRENVTLYGSADAIHWTKLYRMQNGFNGFAYGNVACFGGEMLAVFEDYLNHDIKLHYLTDQQNMFEQLIIE